MSQPASPVSYCSFNGKIIYKAKPDATTALNEIRQRNPGLHVYRCPECSAWHLGHKKRPKMRGASKW